jgi:hypothetical protein
MGVNCRSFRLRNSFIAFVLFLFLSGCATLPRPFQHIEPDPNLRLEYVAGVIVNPVQGMDNEMTAAMTQAMGRAGIPAVANSGSVSAMRLFGELAELEREGQLVRYALQWELQDAEGISIVIKNQSGSASVNEWYSAAPALLRRLADQAAGILSPVLLGEETKPAQTTAPPPAAPPPPRLAIIGVKGAPGDGDKSLARGLDQSLRRLGLKIVPAADADLLIAAKVSMSDGKKGGEHIKLEWRVTRPDGDELGQITQENEIPKGSLNGKWGVIAADIAEATADGVLGVIKRRYAKNR